MNFIKNNNNVIIYFMCLVFMAFLAGCAAEGMPTGGPKDEIGPSLLSTFPADGQLNVKPNAEIVFQFSEAIDYKSVENSLTIFPAMEKAPKIKIGKDVVKIRLSEKLQPNTTYIFSFGRKVQDLQKNMTDGEVKIAFSTGDQMDMASISGKLYDFKESKDPAYILLYKNDAQELDTIINKIPDYFTSVDKFGNYKATNLSKGMYTLATFVGNFKGKPRFTEKSQTAVAFQDFVEISTAMDTITDINFRLGNYPLKNFEYLKAIEEERTLDLTFSHGIDLEKSPNFDIKIAGNSIRQKGYFTTDKPEVLHMNLAGFDSAEYVIEVEGITDIFGRTMVATRDTILWKNKEVIDTVGATVKMDFPTSKDASIHDIVKLTFSEPIQHPDNYNQRIQFFDEDSQAIDFDLKILNEKELNLIPTQSLKYSTKYMVSFLADSIMDFYSNAALDSSRTFSFTTIDNNVFGSISGKVDSKLSLDKVIVCCTPKDPKDIYAWTKVDAQGKYELDQLVPGDYQIFLYYDENGNESYDWGSLVPYQAAEMYKIFAQPVTVRSRWETERVDLRF